MERRDAWRTDMTPVVEGPREARHGGGGRGLRGGLAGLLMLVWAACFVVIKATVPGVPPLWYAMLRALVAGVPLLVVAAARGRLALPRATWGWVAALGLANATLALGGMYLSVSRSGAALPAVLANTQPLLVAPFAARFFGEWLGPAKALALVAGTVGVALTVAPGARGTGEVGGAVFALVSAAGLAAGSLIAKHLAPRVDLVSATGWQYLAGAVPLAAGALATEDISATVWSGGFIAGLAFLALAGSAGGSLAWFWLLRHGEVIRLAAATFLVPAFGLLLAVLLYREPLPGTALVGMAVILASLGVIGWPHETAETARVKA